MKRIVLIFICFLFSMHLGAQQHLQTPKDKPSTHGMLLFGDETIYVSHLPMFHSPHDYQIILELGLSKNDKERYRKDRKLYPNNPTYTIEPEKFVLPDRVQNPRPFKVNLYRGHFERGGELLLENITVTIQQLVYFKKFNPEEPRIATADYILFGNKKEQFVAHVITNKPDFEQIIQVKAPTGAIKDSKFSILTLNKTRNSPIGVSGNKIQVNNLSLLLLEQLYLEFNDLKS